MPSEFKIDRGVPLPTQEALAGQKDSAIPIAKRRGRPPGSKNKRKACKTNTDHIWVPENDHERCSKCSDRFPCESDCTHVDCKEAKGLPLPEWYLENLARNRDNAANVEIPKPEEIY